MTVDEKTAFDPGTTVQEGGTTLFDGGGIPSVSDAAPIARGMTLLDTYRVESDAIEGGMGSVWRVHHTGWNVDLAMKRPQPKCFSTEKSKADFIHECEAWINLGLHPNIVSCYYVREISGTPSIFSEWMDGGSLESAIQKGVLYVGAEAEQKERLLDVSIQFARGLHYAHEAGLIHQDVKPDNVLLTKEGEAKVADFGLARARAVLTVLEGDLTMREAADSGKTMLSPSGAYTPAYCSMEQMDGKALTRRTDIYSWAVSVMEMYIGSRHWANGVVAGLGCRSYLENTRMPIPEALKVLLAQCLESEPENRPHDFAEIESKLHEIYEIETGNAYPRPAPNTAADTADSLNNRALSFLDLGRAEEAEKCWERALFAVPDHVAATYNLLLHRWFACNIDDLEVMTKLEKLHQNLDTSESAEALHLARICRGKDEPVMRIDYDPENLPESMPELTPHISEQVKSRLPGEGRRCVAASGEYALELAWSGAFLWDIAERRLVSEFAVSDAHAVTFMHLSDDGRAALLGVDPKFGIPSSVIERPGSLRLFDTHTGRCVRTLIASGTEEVHSRTQKDHMFGSAKRTADGTGYFYPDYYQSNLRFRRPSMTVLPPVWLLNRVQSYAGAQERERVIQRCTALGKEKLAKLEIGEALQAIGQGYDAAAGHAPEELQKLNAAAGRYGHIAGIRGVTSKNLSGDPPPAGNSTGRAAAPPISVLNPERGGSRQYPLVEIWDAAKKKCLHRIPLKEEIQAFYSVCVSPDLQRLYCLTQWDKHSVGRHLYTIDISTGKLCGNAFEVSGDRLRCVSPDGHTIATESGRGLFFYSIAEGARTAFYTVKDKDTGSGSYLRAGCYRPDGRAVFALTNNHAVVMLDLESGKQYVVREDALIRPGDDTLRNWLYNTLYTVGNGNVICQTERLAKLPFDYTLWTIDYAYHFPGWADWDEGARPYLEIFFTLHPNWTEADFDRLIAELQTRGYGWLRPEGVRTKLNEMRLSEKKTRRGLFSKRK